MHLKQKNSAVFLNEILENNFKCYIIIVLLVCYITFSITWHLLSKSLKIYTIISIFFYNSYEKIFMEFYEVYQGKYKKLFSLLT